MVPFAVYFAVVSSRANVRSMMMNTVKWMSRRSTRSAGFTLIEILLVIVIILLLAGALVVFVLPQQEGAEKNTTRLKLEQVATAQVARMGADPIWLTVRGGVQD